MAATTYYILGFDGDTPQWGFFDGESVTPTEPPKGKVSRPVVALIPDRFFFFYHPKGVTAKNDKAMRAAIRMQMQYNFPAPVQAQDIGTYKTPGGEILGYVSHKGFAEFWERHQRTLEQANVITTPFVMAWSASRAANRSTWIWRSDNGPRVFFDGEGLHYVRASDAELRGRIEQLAPGADPEELDLQWVLGVLAEANVKLSSLRMPLTMLSDDEGVDPRRWMKIFVAVSIIGLFFCIGEAQRLMALQDRAAALEQTVERELGKVLGSDYGSDPYGKLLFQLDRLQGSQTRGIDVLELLGLMSEAAPEGFIILNMSLSGETGTIRAKAKDYNQLDGMLSTLSEKPGYAFSLEQASNTKGGVQVTLKVDFE